MNSLNLIGNITRDIETINTNTGTLMAKCGLAVNKKIQGVDKTMFIDLTFFGKTAETVLNYLHKGSKIAVSGELDFDQWDDAQTGAKRSKHSMSVSRMTMLDSAPQNGQGQGGQPQQNQNQGQQNNNQGYGQQNNGGNQSQTGQGGQNNGQGHNQSNQGQNNGGGQGYGQQQTQMNYGGNQNQGNQNPNENMPQFQNQNQSGN